MSPQTLAALEFDRVLKLVASFARSEWGRNVVLAAPNEPSGSAGLSSYRLASEMARFVAVRGTLSYTGMDAATLLEDTMPEPPVAELVRLIGLVRCICETRAALAQAPDDARALAQLGASLPELGAVLQFCEQRLAPDGSIPDSASLALAQARLGRERSRHALIAALEELRREHRSLVAPFTLRRDRYCVPVPVADRSAVAGLVLDVSATGATVFVEPFAIVDLNNALAETTARARAEEERVLREVAAALARQRDALLQAARLLARLDAFQARTLFGQAGGGVLLEPGSGTCLRLLGARHVLLEPALAPLRGQVLGEEGNRKPVVPLDLEFPEGVRLLLLSGPNAGGKTVALKTVGLTVLMAQAGIPVLAESTSQLPPLADVWCHIGDEQDLFSDLSTFTAAMRATAALLASASQSTLVLYDELGSGTDPEEGSALAAALLEELARRGCWTIATAHLVTVAAHVEQLPGATNAAMGFDERTGHPTYAMQIGRPGRSRALAIAAGCGVPPAVLERSRELVSAAYLALDTHLARLQQETDRVEDERLALARLQLDAEHAKAQLEDQRLALETAREEVRARLVEERDRLRRRAQEQLQTVLAEIEGMRERGEIPGKKRQASLRRAALDFVAPEADAPARAPFSPGAIVRLQGLPGTGAVRTVAGDRIEVLMGDKRLWVEQREAEEVTPAPAARTPGTVVTPAAELAAFELKLIGLTEVEAREALERFLDRAMLAGVRHVRVVHGHGSGTLRRTVQDALRRHAGVESFAHPPQYRGGTGVTEAVLE
ncbi:MAG: Smr/MutS family protein [Acidobacteriota bacterium]